jgi:hypothetical protein
LRLRLTVNKAPELRIVVATAFGTVALVILWFELFWRYCL